MKFSLYGRGEGVQTECFNPLFILVNNRQLVVDMSVSASQAGIIPGMTRITAMSLCPEVEILSEENRLTSSMQFVLNVFWSHTPWIQTERKDSFYVQFPGSLPPAREIRDILLEINTGLSTEQRIRLGFAENPFLARLIVEWSRVERIPGALYRKVGRQYLIVSPKLASNFTKGEFETVESDWWEYAPIQSLWILPAKKRDALMKLGIHRLRDLRGLPDQLLLAQFGRESLLWKQIFEQQPGGSVFVNYPSYEKRSVWIADNHDKPNILFAIGIVEKLVHDLSNQLSHTHSGVLKAGIWWRTDLKEDDGWIDCKHPAYRVSDLLTQIRPLLSEITGNVLEKVEIWGSDIQPISGTQTTFALHEKQFHERMQFIQADGTDIYSKYYSSSPATVANWG